MASIEAEKEHLADLLLAIRRCAYFYLQLGQEKPGALRAVERWQKCRALRNRAAHDHGLAYSLLLQHFKAIHTLIPFLLNTARAFADYVATISG